MRKITEKITAKTIEDLLAIKHKDDVFVPEVKDGRTWDRNHSRIDAIAIKKSYSPFNITGYEIKVSKADFRHDEKWMAYMPLCNSLYFVAPVGIIGIDEVPAQCGLILTSKNGKKLLTKKKAPFREIDFPIGMFKYLIISRSFEKPKTMLCPICNQSSKKVEFDSFVEGKSFYKPHWLSNHIAKTVREKIHHVKNEIVNIKRENESLSDIKDYLHQQGISSKFGYRNAKNDLKQQIESVGLVNRLTDVENAISRLKNQLGDCF